MREELKVALLCNNKMGMPALQALQAKGALCSLATASTDREVITMFSGLAAMYQLPYAKINEDHRWEQLQSWLDTYTPDVVLVMTFPWRIPARLLSIPRYGFVNFHYGLLPEMRGADPVFEVIRQQLPEAGVTVHYMDEYLDTGAILMRERLDVFPGYTYGILCSQLARLSNNMCIKLLDQLATGNMPAGQPQNESKARYWPKVTKEDITINWQQMSAQQIHSLVQACNPAARGAPVQLNGWEFGIYDTSDVMLQGELNGIMPGAIIAIDQQNGLIVACKDGKAIKIDVVNTAEGVFAGYKLLGWGVSVGMQFS